MAVENKEERARKRIALFRGLFCGREDVYARRWEKSDGRSGYSPAALKDWKARRPIFQSYGRITESRVSPFCAMKRLPSSPWCNGPDFGMAVCVV
jgi:hypothetical protein